LVFNFTDNEQIALKNERILINILGNRGFSNESKITNKVGYGKKLNQSKATKTIRKLKNYWRY